jgi:hypothetical protein
MLYRYTLEKYSGIKSRYNCPACNESKRFTRYIDVKTGEHIHSTVGKCDRAISCGYHLTLKQYFKEIGLPKQERVERFTSPKVKAPQKPVSFITPAMFKESLSNYEENNFVYFLKQRFGRDIAIQLIKKYFIGTSSHWKGATVFWQIDIKGCIRSGKIMLYNFNTGKRVKEPYNHINWIHKVKGLIDFNTKQCLFGEHLLRDKSKKVAIVESEKSAIIGSVYMPQFIWLAVGSLYNLKAEMLEPLRGRKVILYPDIKATDKWKAKANELSHIASFAVSDILEKICTEAEREQGLDIADYFLRLPIPEQIDEPEPVALHLPELPPAKDRFKSLLLNEAIQTGFGNTYKWFQIYEKQGLTEREAINATYELRREHGFEIEGEELQPKPKLMQEALRTLPKHINKIDWGEEVEELHSFFNAVELPTYPVQLSKSLFIENINALIKTHIETLRLNNGNKTFEPYLKRLQELKTFLIVHKIG